MRRNNLHKNLHLCTCSIPFVLFILYIRWQLMYFLFVFVPSYSVTHTNACMRAHTHMQWHFTPHHPVCVGFLQTYLYGICILQTFIWLSGLGPRGAGIAWGSVSQTLTDGWVRGVCATLYWVSHDYPTLCFTHTCTHCRRRLSERMGKTDEARKEGERKALKE